MSSFLVKLPNVIPLDKHKIVFLIFFINGIGTLLPWNMLINANQYFVDFKLNSTSTDTTQYRSSFLPFLGIASKVPNLILQLINMLINIENANLILRIELTLFIQIIIFLVIIALAIIDSSTWPGLFFWITMATAVIINLANGVYQGCIYGLAARFPMQYTNAVTMGMNISGTLASILMIISIALSPNLRTEAILFFSSAVVILGFCLAVKFYITHNEFYQFYASNFNTNIKHQNLSINTCPACFENNNNHNECTHLSIDITKAISYKTSVSIGKTNKYKQYLSVFQSIWMLLLNLILIYTISFSLFPAISVNVKSNDHLLSDAYFAPVFCFLSFNLFAALGNIIAQFIQWPGPRYLIYFTLARILFIPFYLFCNYHPEIGHRIVPVIFERDWIYILGSALMALTSGYLSSLCLMYAPKCVASELTTIAGMMSAVTIIIGILIGVNICILFPSIVIHS